jgi:hypothetical protein
VSLPRGSCPQCGELVLGASVCRACARSLVVGAVMAVASGASHVVVAEVVAEATDRPAMLRSIRQALTGGPGALLVGAPPSVGRLVAALRERGVDLPEPVCTRCGRRNLKLIASPEGGVCHNCRRRQLASECSSCGLVKVTYGRETPPEVPCARCVLPGHGAHARCALVYARSPSGPTEIKAISATSVSKGRWPRVASVIGNDRVTS